MPFKLFPFKFIGKLKGGIDMPELILISNCLIFLKKLIVTHLPVCLLHYWSCRNPDFEDKLLSKTPEDQLDALTLNVSSQSQSKPNYLLIWIKVCKKAQRISSPDKDLRFSIFMANFLKIKVWYYLNTEGKKIQNPSYFKVHWSFLHFRFSFACILKSF